MKLRLILLTIGLVLLSSFTSLAQSDDDAQVQEFFSYIDEDNPIIYFDLFNMDEGTTVYIYAESYDFDTLVGVCDIACEEVFASNDDYDYPATTNSALEYTFEEDGDYSIYIWDCCDEEAEGVFRILIGLETPEVLDGEIFPTGDQFAVIYQPTFVDLREVDYDDDDEQSQQFYGSVDEDNPVVFYDIEDAEEGQTLYLYAESNDINSVISICYEDCEEPVLSPSDVLSSSFSTSFEYTFEEDGDYRIIVSDCCNSKAEGRFRLVLGYNLEDISNNEFLPNGARIATVYEPPRSLAQNTIDRNEEIINENCEDVDLSERPELSGDEETVETENFIIHYTEDGDDEADDDFVEEVADFVEFVFEVQVNELGWPAPPRDCGEGGDSRYDFYLINILDNESILGYASPEEIVGDNPATEIEEEWAAYGYMVIDNDYDGVPSPLVVMRATIAHEFHHLIQFGYETGEPARWIYEATSSWIETKTSITEQDVVGYTSTVFNEPNLCIGTSEDRNGLRVYGDWLLIDSIARDYGDESIQRLWEIVIEEEGMDVFYEFIDELDTTPEDVLRRFAIRNLLLDYELGDEFPDTVDVEETIEDFETYDSGRDGIEEMAVQYLFIRESDTYTFELDNNDLTMVVVGINPDDDEVDIYDIGTEGTVDTRPYDYAYVIVMNTEEHDDPSDCSEEDWEIDVRDGSDDNEDDPNGETFNVENFDPAD
ncbi:MAG: hypothetical protein Phog2KO_05260 [Phototrophicaceae bacterium]